MTNIVSLLSCQGEISKEEFRVRLNEINLGLPQNLGRGFMEWLCESVQARSLKFSGVTPEIMESWLSGADAPTTDLRNEFLVTAHAIVKSESMTEKEFLSHVRYSKGFMEKWLERKHSSVMAWANDFFFYRITLITPVELDAAQAWFGDRKDTWMFVPRHWLRMMVVRAVAEAASEVIMRDEFSTYQDYVYVT